MRSLHDKSQRGKPVDNLSIVCRCPMIESLAALANRRTIDRVIVGNETQLFGLVSAEQLNAYILRVRNALDGSSTPSSTRRFSVFQAVAAALVTSSRAISCSLTASARAIVASSCCKSSANSKRCTNLVGSPACCQAVYITLPGSFAATYGTLRRASRAATRPPPSI